MLSMPAPTPFDLNFRLFGIPIQVSPWFWIVTLMIGSRGQEDIQRLPIWVGCVFVSILIHELGHGLTGKFFGARPRIALYGMGGLCASDGERTPRQRLAVLIMGPGAQFLLLGAVFLVGWLAWGVTWRADLAIVKEILGIGSEPRGVADILADRGQLELALSIPRMGFLVFYGFRAMVFINLLWALLNLLPIYPLDGGQIAQVFLVAADPLHGARRTHIVSLVTAGGLAAYLASQMGSSGETAGLMRVVFLGYLALINYQALQAHHDRYMANGPDDADWWKR